MHWDADVVGRVDGGQSGSGHEKMSGVGKVSSCGDNDEEGGMADPAEEMDDASEELWCLGVLCDGAGAMTIEKSIQNFAIRTTLMNYSSRTLVL